MQTSLSNSTEVSILLREVLLGVVGAAFVYIPKEGDGKRSKIVTDKLLFFREGFVT